jgi:hypothetical protein
MMAKRREREHRYKTLISRSYQQGQEHLPIQTTISSDGVVGSQWYQQNQALHQQQHEQQRQQQKRLQQQQQQRHLHEQLQLQQQHLQQNTQPYPN